MRPISVHVEEADYEELKALAARSGRPVAELIRQAMADYVEGHRERPSVRDIPPLEGGRRIRRWTREEIYDEMFGAPAPNPGASDEEVV
jgi:hypothetical protein